MTKTSNTQQPISLTDWVEEIKECKKTSLAPVLREKTHNCGGNILMRKDENGRTFFVCDNCRAFVYLYDVEGKECRWMPNGIDAELNAEYWQSRQDESPMAPRPTSLTEWQKMGNDRRRHFYVAGTVFFPVYFGRAIRDHQPKIKKSDIVLVGDATYFSNADAAQAEAESMTVSAYRIIEADPACVGDADISVSHGTGWRMV